MFAQLHSETGRGRRVRLGSLAAHALILAWLLHSPKAILLNPVSLAVGHNGTSVTRLYWDSKTTDKSTHSSSDLATERYQHQRFAHQKIALTLPAQAKAAPNAHAPKQDTAPTQTLSAEGHGAQAGIPYGTLRGDLYGEEVRPALPIATSDPVVYPWQLPTAPGNEVIEITIDERGNIINKIVLQSLGPEIDDKCLTALDNWRFAPATRKGSPIPSKQDAIFPFKARG
jgi:outer membrane biosynthesis protein TonB